jgi:hypothetical protein
MYGYLKDYFLIDHACRMSFFSQGIHGRGNKGRGNWNRGPGRPGSLYILTLIHKILAKCFMQDSLIGLGRE